MPLNKFVRRLGVFLIVSVEEPGVEEVEQVNRVLMPTIAFAHGIVFG